jgi:hypothetical protein
MSLIVKMLNGELSNAQTGFYLIKYSNMEFHNMKFIADHLKNQLTNSSLYK